MRSDYSDIQSQILDDYFLHIARHRIGERLLIAQGETYVIGAPATYRWLKPETFNHVFYVVYGDNVAFQILGTPHRMIIIRNPGIADMFRRQFEFNWAMAETPWFAKRYKVMNPNEPWSCAKAAAAREWIAEIQNRNILALNHFKLFRCLDQRRTDAGFERRMAGIGNDAIFGFRPALKQFMRRDDRAYHVISALHDHAREFGGCADVVEQLVIWGEELFLK